MLLQDGVVEQNYFPLRDVLQAFLSNRRNLSIFHLNTQSIFFSFAKSKLLAETYKTDSETWLKDDPNVLQYLAIPGYQFIYKNRNTKRGAGVGLFFRVCMDRNCWKKPGNINCYWKHSTSLILILHQKNMDWQTEITFIEDKRNMGRPDGFGGWHKYQFTIEQCHYR